MELEIGSEVIIPYFEVPLLPAAEIYTPRKNYLLNLAQDENVKEGPVPLEREGKSHLLHFHWPSYWEDKLSMCVNYDKAEEDFPNFREITDFVLTKFILSNRELIPLDIYEDPHVWHPLCTYTHESIILKHAERNLCLVLQHLAHTPPPSPSTPYIISMNSHKLNGAVRDYKIHLDMPVSIINQLSSNYVRIEITEFIISHEIRTQIQQKYPGWTEADGLQILTTPFLRSHMLEYYGPLASRGNKNPPILDVDGEDYGILRPVDHEVVSLLGLIMITAFPSKIDFKEPWIFLDNGATNLRSFSDQFQNHKRAAAELLFRDNPMATEADIPFIASHYFSSLATARMKASSSSLYFIVNNMTDEPLGTHFLNGYFSFQQRGSIDVEVHVNYIRDYHPEKNSQSHIRKICYEVPIDFVLDHSDGKSLMRSLTDKSKLEVQRVRREITRNRRRHHMHLPFRTLDINHQDSTAIEWIGPNPLPESDEDEL